MRHLQTLEHTLSLRSLLEYLDVNDQEFEARRRPADFDQEERDKASFDEQVRRRPENFEVMPEKE